MFGEGETGPNRVLAQDSISDSLYSFTSIEKKKTKR